MNKNILSLLLIFSLDSFSQEVDIPLDTGTNAIVDSSNADISAKTTLSEQELTDILGGTGSNGGINSFFGPNGCTECTVAPDTDFQLFWDVENVAGCTGSNTANHFAFNGNLEPFGGGTGQYQKNIVGGLPANSGTTTFTLDCPVVSTKNYVFKSMVVDVMELTIPSDTRMLVHNSGKAMTLINVVVDKYLKTDSFVRGATKSIREGLYFNEVVVKDLNDFQLSLNYDKSFDLKYGVKTWLYISEIDGRYEKSDPYESGRCDAMALKPSLRLSTLSIMKNKLTRDCTLDPDKKYYLTRIYLTE